MTNAIGWLLYVLAILIAVWFWRRVRGQSFAEILRRRTEEHHRVTEVLAQYPAGGTWPEYRRWERLSAMGENGNG